MPAYRGKVVCGEEVLVEDTTIRIYVATAANGLSSWSGSFDLPDQHCFSFDDYEECTIVLENGSRGRVIPRVAIGRTVEFQGTGEFG